MRVNYKNTPENYRAMVEIIIPPLLDLLKSLTLLEEEIFERNRALDKEKKALASQQIKFIPSGMNLWMTIFRGKCNF
ncbi:hypothetical protein HMPREF9954_1152 [Streptococcus infantis SK970]|nr:hypothetical protein HMPREF9954_1152 [Streptococcus infantis SK970]